MTTPLQMSLHYKALYCLMVWAMQGERLQPPARLCQVQQVQNPLLDLLFEDLRLACSIAADMQRSMLPHSV